MMADACVNSSKEPDNVYFTDRFLAYPVSDYRDSQAATLLHEATHLAFHSLDAEPIGCDGAQKISVRVWPRRPSPGAGAALTNAYAHECFATFGLPNHPPPIPPYWYLGPAAHM